MEYDFFYCGKKYPERSEAVAECTCPDHSAENPEGCSLTLQQSVGQRVSTPCRYFGTASSGTDYADIDGDGTGGVCLRYKDAKTKECWLGPPGVEFEDCCSTVVDENLCRPEICASTAAGKTEGPCIFNYQKVEINGITQEFGICMPYKDSEDAAQNECPALSTK